MNKGLYTINFQGINVSVENPIGSFRTGEDENGNKWETRFYHPYGYIVGVEGTDGDYLDCFIGPNPTSDKVFVIYQKKADGTFDEHKVMLGFNDLISARDAYLAHYATQGFLGYVKEFPLFEFKELIKQHMEA